MRRSKAFILSEILMTILLQAGLILVLCMSFYLFLDFYTRTQQILTARNHAERVIQFMDDKIRNAGLGLWDCNDSATIRGMLSKIKLFETSTGWNGPKAYKLPVSLSWFKNGVSTPPKTAVPQNGDVMKGDVVALLYSQRNLSEKLILTTGKTVTIDGTGYVSLIDTDYTTEHMDETSFELAKELTGDKANEGNIKSYAVAEAVGIPMHVSKYLPEYGLPVKTGMKINIPGATELMYLKCMLMFVHDPKDGNGRQFAFRELKSNGKEWDATYNQEKDILDIYMTIDPRTNIFTIYVLATGGYDPNEENPRPASWPNKANPRPEDKEDDDEISDNEAEKAWLESDYCHHRIYISRKSWKLNNLEHFTRISWN